MLTSLVVLVVSQGWLSIRSFRALCWTSTCLFIERRPNTTNNKQQPNPKRRRLIRSPNIRWRMRGEFSRRSFTTHCSLRQLQSFTRNAPLSVISIYVERLGNARVGRSFWSRDLVTNHWYNFWMGVLGIWRLASSRYRSLRALQVLGIGKTMFFALYAARSTSLLSAFGICCTQSWRLRLGIHKKTSPRVEER